MGVELLTAATKWTVLANGMAMPSGVKGIFIKAGGTCVITDTSGISLTLTAAVDSFYPLRPTGVTSATDAYLLSG